MSEESEINSSFEFWIVGVMITVVSMVGIIGNIICILMFQYKRLNINRTFASLLKWLAVIDSIFLVNIKWILSFIPTPPHPLQPSKPKPFSLILQVMCFSVFSLPVLSQYYKIWIFPYILPSLLPPTSISLTVN